MQKYIIDVDTGIDDALALFYVYNNIAEKVLGITVCGGNVKLEDATRNTLRITELLGWTIPIFSGSSKSIEGKEFVHAYDYHGSDGLCDTNLKTEKKEQNLSAEDFIINSVDENEKISIICLATPTNLAKAILKRPEIAKKIEGVTIMGGAVDVPGNQTEYAEYNFFQDPKAVEIVLENCKNITIVPLDVTNQCIVPDKQIEELSGENKISLFFKEAVINWYRLFGYPKKRQFELYDPLAISAVIDDRFLSFKDFSIGINIHGLKEGEIFVGGKYPVRIATEVKGPEFVNYFIKCEIEREINDIDKKQQVM